MMESQKHKLNEFISIDMFMSLTGCIMLVCTLVQILKGYIAISPLWLNLVCSFFISSLRIIFKEDFSFKGILLGLMQIIPILLGASGTYEVLKNILN